MSLLLFRVAVKSSVLSSLNDTQNHFNLKKKNASRASDVLVGYFFFYFPYHNPLSYPLLLELKSG